MLPPDGDFMVHATKLNTVHLGEGLGWATIVIGGMSAVGSFFHLSMATVTPGDVQPWVILVAGVIVMAVGVGITVYNRILKAILDGQSLTQKATLDGQAIAAIYAANNLAIAQGKPVPRPEYLPPPPALPPNTIMVSPQAGPDPEAPK